jgi:hypothetical protein
VAVSLPAGFLRRPAWTLPTPSPAQAHPAASHGIKPTLARIRQRRDSSDSLLPNPSGSAPPQRWVNSSLGRPIRSERSLHGPTRVIPLAFRSCKQRSNPRGCLVETIKLPAITRGQHSPRSPPEPRPGRSRPNRSRGGTTYMANGPAARDTLPTETCAEVRTCTSPSPTKSAQAVLLLYSQPLRQSPVARCDGIHNCPRSDSLNRSSRGGGVGRS